MKTIAEQKHDMINKIVSAKTEEELIKLIKEYDAIKAPILLLNKTTK